MTVLLALTLASGLASSPDLGKAEGQCRTGESGPALSIVLKGMKDRTGWLKAEVYPSNDADFLQDDNILLNAGKVFRRVEVPVPKLGEPTVCIRVPRAGPYSLIVLHDRDTNHRFNWMADGIGLPGAPRLGWSKPKASTAGVKAGPGMTEVEVTMQYKRGLHFAPLGGARP